jgi:lycopene cyclase domain-containing protein
MTYFGFLAIFLVLPIIALMLVARRDARLGRTMPVALTTWAPWTLVAAHSIIAVLWTTPWDSYLIATRVWWYQPELVTGLTFLYIPIEEYTFFVLQPILTGLWLLFVIRHYPVAAPVTLNSLRIRRIVTACLGLAWVGFAALLASGWQPGTYLGLLMIWAIPPMMIQSAFGADILWRHRRIALMTIIPMTAYLAAADKLAITNGIWTINPAQSLQAIGINLLGRLPLEELLFFLLTNMLVTLGITLVTSAESKVRADRWVAWFKSTLEGLRAPARTPAKSTRQ